MKVIETKIPGVLIVETDVFGDHRGYFTETYSKPKYEKLGITVDFVQDNMSFSAQKGTLRGLHWQNPPYARYCLENQGARHERSANVRQSFRGEQNAGRTYFKRRSGTGGA